MVAPVLVDLQPGSISLRMIALYVAGAGEKYAKGEDCSDGPDPPSPTLDQKKPDLLKILMAYATARQHFEFPREVAWPFAHIRQELHAPAHRGTRGSLA